MSVEALQFHARYAWVELKKNLRIRLSGDKHHMCERIVRGVKAGAISPRSAFTIAPRTDGLGSQLLARLSVMAAARDFGMEYVHTPFQSIAHAEGDPLQWRDRCERVFALGEGKCHREQSELPLADFITYAQDKRLWSTPHLIAVQNMYVHCNRSPQLYTAITCPPRRLMVEGQRCKIAVHVRRGDVATNKVSHRFTPNKEILATLGKLVGMLRRAEILYDVDIFSNGNIDEFRDFADLGYRVNVTHGAIETFEQLRRADILLTAKSTFSYAAALFSGGIVFYQGYSHRPLPAWIIRGRGGDFSEADFARKMRDHFIA